MSARPGAVCAPPGGPAQFPAQIISQKAGAHAQIGDYGLRWPQSTNAISARSRPGLESRSRAEIAYVLRGHIRPYFTTQAYTPALLDIINAKKCPDPPVGSQTAPGRALTLCGVRAREGENCERAVGRRLRPPGRPTARFPAQRISQRAELHACVGGYGLRWPRGTYAISARSRH